MALDFLSKLHRNRFLTPSSSLTTFYLLNVPQGVDTHRNAKEPQGHVLSSLMNALLLRGKLVEFIVQEGAYSTYIPGRYGIARSPLSFGS